MNLRLSARDQFIVAGIVILLVLGLFIFFLLRPQLARITALAAEEKQERTKLEEAKLTLQRLEAVKKEAAQTEAKLVKLTKKFPEDAEIPSLLIELEEVTNDVGLEFSIQLQGVSEKSGYGEVPFNISTKSSFFDLIDYLYRLENLPRKVIVENVSISGDEESYPMLDVSITAKAFKMSVGSQPAAEGGTPSPPPPPTQPQS